MQEAATGRRRPSAPATLQRWARDRSRPQGLGAPGSPDGPGSSDRSGSSAEPDMSSAAARTAALWGQVLPVGAWREALGDVVLRGRAEGRGISLLAARGDALRRRGPVPDGEVRIDLAQEDADWIWFDGDLDTVEWNLADAPADASRPEPVLPPITVVMPTFRREADAVAQVARFAAMSIVGRILVIDQGGTLAHHAGFARLLAGPARIELIAQPNLGGSGGYARGMLEASADPSAAILLSDDDAVIDEESLRRMLMLQTLAAGPTVVGAPLFSAHDPLRLIAHTEAVDVRSFQWRPADGMRGEIDLAGTGPADWGFLAEHAGANYTGWWATLFPPGTVDDLGLPSPYFLKWDDAEYGLRATRRGFAHAVLPGTSVHHPPWNAHRTQMTWTARVLHRNRLATAAAYGASRGVLVSSLLHQIKHIVSGQHLTALLWEEGLDSFRAGPETWLGTDLGRARSDGQAVVDAWTAEQEAALETLPAREGRPALLPTRRHRLPLPRAAARAGLRLLRPDRPPRIVLAVPADELRWRTILGADAVVIAGDDHATSPLLVLGSTGRRLLRRTLLGHARIALRWGRLQDRYRTALPRHTAAEAWLPLFASGSGPGSGSGSDIGSDADADAVSDASRRSTDRNDR
ncbi:glycosyltransferase [Brachybacterium sp. DNPG3]